MNPAKSQPTPPTLSENQYASDSNRSKVHFKPTPKKGWPNMQEFLEKVKPQQKKYFIQMRSKLRTLPEVEETIEIDEVSGEWCPVYRVKGSDLVWVHFDEHLWVNFPVEPKFEKKALQDENLDSYVVECVKDADETGGEKWATVEIKSGEQVDQILPLLELRHSVLAS